jgi:hypothetical protein
MMINLAKAVRDSYWWEAEGDVLIDIDCIESMETMYDHTPGGSRSAAYVLITMKSGVQHKVLCALSKLEEMMA